MATIVLAWELGGGLGHVVPLRALGDVLSARGHQVVMLLRDMSAYHVLRGAAASILPAPTLAGNVPIPVDPPYTFAHLLHNCGFGDEFSLEIRARSWLSLFEYIRPDVVLVDHSPGALIALRATEAARATFGTGFCIPIDEYPLRSRRPFPPADPDILRRDEDRVYATVSRVIASLRGRPIERLGQLFSQVDETFLTTYEELDHYPDRRAARYWGSLSRAMGASPAWPNIASPRIYAYLKPFAGISALLALLNDFGGSTVVVGDGLDPTLPERFGGGNIHFEPSVVDVGAAARECDVALLNGTHGTTSNMLLAGKPLLLIPLTHEQYETASRVEQLGAGLAVPFFDAAELQTSLQAVLNLRSYRRRAENFASRYQDWTTDRQVALMADRIEELPCR